jgi:hypothetical protein
MHREKRITERMMRVSASDGKETWVYQFPEPLWRTAVKRIMQDMREAKLPEEAAGGILEMITEGVVNGD